MERRLNNLERTDIPVLRMGLHADRLIIAGANQNMFSAPHLPCMMA